MSSCAAQHANVRCEERNRYESWCVAHYGNELSYAEFLAVAGSSSAVAHTVAEGRTVAEAHAVDEGHAIDGAFRYESRDSESAAGTWCVVQRVDELLCAAPRVDDFRVGQRQCALSYEGQDRRACFGDSAARKRFALQATQMPTTTGSISISTSETPES